MFGIQFNEYSLRKIYHFYFQDRGYLLNLKKIRTYVYYSYKLLYIEYNDL